jgi:AAA domain
MPQVIQGQEYFGNEDHATQNGHDEKSGFREGLRKPPEIKFTFRKPLEIMAMQFDAEDSILENGYLEKGSPIAICGIGGIGKSRLILQAAIDTALGRSFLGWKTNGKGLKWLFLQTENGNKRLKSDLAAMMENLTETERQFVNEAITIHTLETEDDGLMFLSNPHICAALQKAVTEKLADIVVFDPLRDFAAGDLNSDADMAATLATISRIVRYGNPKRIAFIVHHALSGKAGHAKATGFERGGFGRNSKVLQSYVRAMINLAPYDAESNEVLIVASGKSNNSEEFQPFAVRLNFATMTYDQDDSVDIDDWKERVGADIRSNKATIAHVAKIVSNSGLNGITKVELKTALVDETGASKATAYRLIDKAERNKAITRRKDDELYVVPG